MMTLMFLSLPMTLIIKSVCFITRCRLCSLHHHRHINWMSFSFESNYGRHFHWKENWKWIHFHFSVKHTQTQILNSDSILKKNSSSSVFVKPLNPWRRWRECLPFHVCFWIPESLTTVSTLLVILHLLQRQGEMSHEETRVLCKILFSVLLWIHFLIYPECLNIHVASVLQFLWVFLSPDGCWCSQKERTELETKIE
jgi:hypothetical protein